MKIALYQMDIAWLDVRTNLQKIERAIKDAHANGAKILVLPEMALTGFCMDEVSASLSLDSPEIKDLTQMTCGTSLLVFAGAAIRRNGQHFNECLVIKNGEILTSYAKMNLFVVTEEHKHYEPGNRLVTIEHEGYRFTPLICFDTRFTQPFITGAQAGTDAFIIMASWPDAQATQWKTLLSARAMDTQAFVIGVNRVGSGGGLNFAGDCNIVAPSGKAMLECTSDEQLIVVDVDFSYSRKLKEKFPVLSQQHLVERKISADFVTIT